MIKASSRRDSCDQHDHFWNEFFVRECDAGRRWTLGLDVIELVIRCEEEFGVGLDTHLLESTRTPPMDLLGRKIFHWDQR